MISIALTSKQHTQPFMFCLDNPSLETRYFQGFLALTSKWSPRPPTSKQPTQPYRF